MPLPAGGICGACLHTPPPQEASWAAFEYGGAVASLLQRLKFSGRLQNAQILGELLLESAPPLAFRQIDCLIPAPLHLCRLRQRGFNQSLELARPLARHHQLDIRQDLLRRARDTEEQSRLSAKARMRNVAGAFRVTEPLAGEHILLLDDVMTTGATMRAMTETLLAAGAGRVSTLAVARALTR